MFRHALQHHDIGQRSDHLRTRPAALRRDHQALASGLVDQVQDAHTASIMRSCAHEVVAPHMVRVRRPEPHTRSIVEPQPPSRLLLLRYLEPLTTPDALDSIRQGAGVFRLDVPRVLGDEENELPPSMRTLLADLWNDFKLLESRIEDLSKQIQRSVQYSDTARRLMTVPGIGPLAASALEASDGNGHQFANGKFRLAWTHATRVFHRRQNHTTWHQ